MMSQVAYVISFDFMRIVWWRLSSSIINRCPEMYAMTITFLFYLPNVLNESDI